MSCEPWQCAEIAATKKANPIKKPEIAVAMIKKAQHPLLIAGSNLTERFMEGRPAIEFIIDLANASKVPVVATAHMVGEFIKRGYQPAAHMNAMEIGQRVGDPHGRTDGKGHPTRHNGRYAHYASTHPCGSQALRTRSKNHDS